jgi:hypothetical protein
VLHKRIERTFAHHSNSISISTSIAFIFQKQILARYRSLGIAGHLPAFGGYAPWAVAVAQNATGRIAQGKGAAVDTAWIDGRDPLYTVGRQTLRGRRMGGGGGGGGGEVQRVCVVCFV